MSDLSRGNPPGAEQSGNRPPGSVASGQRTLADAREDLHAAAATIGSQATEAKDRIGEQAGAVIDEAKAQGAEVADAARERAEDLAEQGKAAGAERAHGLADAVRHVADDLEGSSPEIARHVRAAAESVDGVAAALRDRSVGDLVNEVGAFARRQPGAFFGAALVAGFAISRFAKSSAEGGSTGSQGRSGGGAGAGGVPQHGSDLANPAALDRTTASGAPGWVPEVGAAVTAPHRSHPATMAAASLGGAVAHRAGAAVPGSMPTDVEVAVAPSSTGGFSGRSA